LKEEAIAIAIVIWSGRQAVLAPGGTTLRSLQTTEQWLTLQQFPLAANEVI